MSYSSDRIFFDQDITSELPFFMNAKFLHQNGHNETIKADINVLNTELLLYILPAKLKSENMMLYGLEDEEPESEPNPEQYSYLDWIKKYPHLSPTIVAMIASAEAQNLSMDGMIEAIEIANLKIKGQRDGIIKGNENTAKKLQAMRDNKKGYKINIKANGELFGQLDIDKRKSKSVGAKIAGLIISFLLLIVAMVATALCPVLGAILAAVIGTAALICTIVEQCSNSLKVKAGASAASFFFNFNPFSQISEIVYDKEIENSDGDRAKQNKAQKDYEGRQKWTAWADLAFMIVSIVITACVSITEVAKNAIKMVSDVAAKVISWINIVAAAADIVLSVVTAVFGIIEAVEQIKVAKLNYSMAVQLALIESYRSSLETENETLSEWVDAISRTGEKGLGLFASASDLLKSSGDTNIAIARNISI